MPGDRGDHWRVKCGIRLLHFAAEGGIIQWLGRHPRWTFHFTPTSASWINAVEGFFARLTRRRLKRGVFHSLVSLQEAINRFVAEANTEPKPFHWAKDPDTIIAAVRRGPSSPPSDAGTKCWITRDKSHRRPASPCGKG
jgi:hypothetical protein